MLSNLTVFVKGEREGSSIVTETFHDFEENGCPVAMGLQNTVVWCPNHTKIGRWRLIVNFGSNQDEFFYRCVEN